MRIHKFGRVRPIQTILVMVAIAALLAVRAGATGFWRDWETSPAPTAWIWSYEQWEEPYSLAPGDSLELNGVGSDQDSFWWMYDDGASVYVYTGGQEDDEIQSYSWTCTGGFFETDPAGSSVVWRAPLTDGTYTVSLVVEDRGQLPTGDTGERKDGPSPPATVTVIVGEGAPEVRWEPGEGIRLANPDDEPILTPAEGLTVYAGETVACAAANFVDLDTRIAPDNTTHPPDEIKYGWSGGGSFSGPTNRQTATWIAPADAGAYQIQVRVNDVAIIPEGEVGDRNDAHLDFTISVTVVPRLELYLKWTSDFTTTPNTHQCTTSGTFGSPGAKVRVRFRGPVNGTEPRIQELRFQEEGSATPGIVLANLSLNATADPHCDASVTGECRYANIGWPAPLFRDRSYAISALVEFQPAGAVAPVVLQAQMTVQKKDLLVEPVNPANPNPIVWTGNPQAAEVSATVSASYRRVQPIRLTLYDGAGGVVKTYTADQDLGGGLIKIHKS